MSAGPAGQPVGPFPLTGLPEEKIGFTDGTVVDVSEVSDRDWLVLREFSYYAKSACYTVQAQQRTDFASVPRAFVWFIPSYGRYTKAAILHDALCELSLTGGISRRDADGVFRQAMRSLGVPFLRRWIMWAAVRLWALRTAAGRKDWGKDALPVLVVALPVVPVVLPAALLVSLTLLLWHVVELAFWVPLVVVERSKRSAGKPTKRVNAPTLSMRM